MRLRTRVSFIISAALVGLIVMASFGLYTMRQNMLQERRTQITQLLDFADAQLKYFYSLETGGKLSREEAQSRAKESVGAQKKDSNYFFVRTADNTIIVHGITARVGKVDDGGKIPDGRTLVQQYREGLEKSGNNRFFVIAPSPQANREGKFPKLNGLTKFEPWDWLYGIGFFVDDIDNIFWESARIFLLLGALIISAVTILALLTMRSILGQLGGEPAYAAEIAFGISKGDLSRSIDAKGREDSLLGSMRLMQSGLHSMVERFIKASITLASASKHLTEETTEISRGSQKTSEATTSTAAAIEEMTISINQISDRARETEDNSRQAAELATHGENLAIKAAVEIRRISTDISSAAELIRGLVDRSREIDSMSAAIKEIADQTNLLALNAAIEAARAGESGRGFAVVADEVRKLAERTTGATKDITVTIRAIQSDTDVAASRMDGIRDQVVLGVDLVEKAAQALRDINEGTRATLEKTRDVAIAAKEQSEASNSIAANVERIAQMVEEADASVQAANGEVRQLDDLARELSAAAEKFKL